MRQVLASWQDATWGLSADSLSSLICFIKDLIVHGFNGEGKWD
jgi:hypothetical protein